MRRMVWLVLAVLAPFAALGQETVPYEAKINGAPSADLADKLEAEARLIQAKEDQPASMVSLRRRAEADMSRLVEVLRSEGYYDGKASFTMDEDKRPVPVEVTIDAGPRYRIEAFNVRLDHAANQPEPEPVPISDLGLAIGEPARAQLVVTAQAALLKALAEQGFPLAKVWNREAVVDHAALTMRVNVVVAAGPQCHFGPVTVTGLTRLREKWVRARLPWQEGERFSVSQMELLRKRLVESRLFSSVKLSTAKEVDAQGRLPITVELNEAKRRSFGLGASWASSEGFGGRAFWEHRNILGGAERLRAELTASQIRNAVDITARVPDLGRPDQDGIAAFTAEEQRTDAYITRTVGGSAGMEWVVSPTWRVSASTAVERTFEDRNDQTRQFTLVSFPLEARHDDTDELLDPSRGNRLRVQVRPFVRELGTVGFQRFEINDSHYIELLNDPRVILAGWVQFGVITGIGLADVPSDKRFYVGGGGSVRAYGFQKAGPLDQNGNPLGGLSALAFGGEVRIKVTDTIGIVPFIEAGNAYETRLPDPGQDLRWGAGLGLRYFTPIGPVRADIAVPLNPRRGVDSPFQVYLSLGQAF
ncbi:MAG TPA: autotransporter assembly complex family protein [Magnetospirillum sp.]|jgi:translocation and assembly module TamA|nr:autotransporter assembly complex family protein [Magnetospirillum sp.]